MGGEGHNLGHEGGQVLVPVREDIEVLVGPGGDRDEAIAELQRHIQPVELDVHERCPFRAENGATTDRATERSISVQIFDGWGPTPFSSRSAWSQSESASPNAPARHWKSSYARARIRSGVADEIGLESGRAPLELPSTRRNAPDIRARVFCGAAV